MRDASFLVLGAILSLIAAAVVELIRDHFDVKRTGKAARDQLQREIIREIAVQADALLIASTQIWQIMLKEKSDDSDVASSELRDAQAAANHALTRLRFGVADPELFTLLEQFQPKCFEIIQAQRWRKAKYPRHQSASEANDLHTAIEKRSGDLLKTL